MSDEPRSRQALLEIVRDAPGPSSDGAGAVMRGDRRRDTQVELQLRRELHRQGLRFRVDYAIRCGLARPVRPDVVFTKARVAVFVDGCFWNGCPLHGTKPRSNAGYWSAKIELNRDRDARQSAALISAGWRVVRVWEHEPVDAAASTVAATVSSSQAAMRAGRASSARKTD